VMGSHRGLTCQLTITGERKERERVGILRRRTRRVGRFEYDIQLPGDLDDKVSAPNWPTAC
jgi:HSP20 family protein